MTAITYQEASKKLESEEKVDLKSDVTFFKVKRDDNRNFKGFSINELKLVSYLYSLGIRRFDIGKSRLFVKIKKERLCSETDPVEIQDIFFDSLESFKDLMGEGVEVSDLTNYFYKYSDKFFKKDILHRIRPKEPIQFVEDKKNEKNFYFKNGFVTVNKNGLDFNSYSKLNGFIFENLTIQKDFEKNKPQNKSFFEQFILLVTQRDGKTDIERFNSLKSIIGYNLHSFADSELKATIFTDSKISEYGEAQGRTGKTLISKAIGYLLCNSIEDPSMKTFVMINGKDFDPEKETKYQRCGLETKLICLNDLKNYFDIEHLYNDITEGISVKQLYKDPFFIRPKIILNTNKTIKIQGASSKARVLEFEISNYFSDSHSPQQEFKHWFFRDWNTTEWARFYWFMIECCQFYFEHGILEAKSINLEKRKLIETTSQEFVEFMTDLDPLDNSVYERKVLFDRFIENYRDFEKTLKQKRFTQWLINYTQYHELFMPFKKDIDEGKNENGNRTIRFRKR